MLIQLKQRVDALKREVDGLVLAEQLGTLKIEEGHEAVPFYDPHEVVNTKIRSNPMVGEVTRQDLHLTKEEYPDLPAGYILYRDLDTPHIYLQRIDTGALRRLEEVSDPLGEMPGYNFPDPEIYPWAVRKRA